MWSSVTLSTTNPTWTGTLREKLGLVSENVLCYIMPYVNTEFFLRPYEFIMDVLHYSNILHLSCNTLMWFGAVPDAVTCHSQMEANCL